VRYDINPLLALDLDYRYPGDDRIDIPDSQYEPSLPDGRQHKQLCRQCDLPVRPTAADQPPPYPRAAGTLAWLLLAAGAGLALSR
jgi:hypothetical protein